MKRPDIKEYTSQFGDSQFEIDMANYIASIENLNKSLNETLEEIKHNTSSHCESCRFIADQIKTLKGVSK